jgi:hypothetical protein
LVSQLLTAGRLANGFGEMGLYGIRYDEVANQFVLNMMEIALKKSEQIPLNSKGFISPVK